MALSVIFDHDDNVAVPLTTTSIATQATLVGTVVGFPANVETNVPQTVTFTFANHGSADATINTTTLAFPDSIGPRTNTCTNSLVLSPGQHCTITDTLKNATPGPLTWSATANYTGGFANNPLNVTQNTSTTVGDAVVTGSVITAVPVHVATNMARTFEYRFANKSSLPATDIKIVKSLPYTTNVSDSCGTTLPGGTDCTIQGTFNANFAGPQALSVTLLYKEGAAVTLNNTAMITDALVQSASITPTTSYSTPNMTQYSLDGTRRAGFVVLPELQSAVVTGAPTSLTWAVYATTPFSVKLQRVQDGQDHIVNFLGSKNNACGTFTMNSAASCYTNTGQFRLSSGNNQHLPSGTYTGQLLVSMQDWLSTYRQMLVLNITYTK